MPLSTKPVTVPVTEKSPFADSYWMESPVTGSRTTVPPASYFRKEFILEPNVISARLRITALGLYECCVNGTRVGDAVFSPGWSDYTKRCYFQTYNVLELLRDGTNALGIILGDGWYSGNVGWGGRQAYGDKPQIILELEVMYQDGRMMAILSDDSWKSTVGPILENDLMMGETYDARLEMPGWEYAGFDDSSWRTVGVADPKPVSLIPSFSPPVRRISELQPVTVTSLTDRIFPARLYDFGQNFSGRARIAIQAPRGTVIKLRFGEELKASGDLYTENLRAAKATDVYVCKGGSREIWEPLFTFHGFRYAEVTGIPDDADFEIVAIVLHSDLPQTGHFACSNDLLNKFQNNILWSQKSNFLEVPTDCPQRDERLGWTGDAQIFVKTACFNMDVHQFFRKWLQDLRDAQNENGAICCVAPRPGFLNIIPMEDGGPGYSDAIVLCPWVLYQQYGDIEVLRENYNAMLRYLEFVSNYRCKDFIRGHSEVDAWGGYGDWLAPDGSGGVEGRTPKDLIGTAFYAHLAELVSDISRILDEEEHADRFRKLRENIVQAFQRRFITSDGLLAGHTQTAYVLALHFNLLPKNAIESAVQELVRDIEKRGHHLATGFIGTPYLLSVLADHGQLETAYKILEQESYPSWLFPVTHGATTVWERWDGWTPDKGMQDDRMNSFNHYAYGAVGAWMYSTVAGINTDVSDPAYRRIVFAPRPGGTLTWAEASLKVDGGLISFRWDREGASLKCAFEVPAGSTATLSPPSGFADDCQDFPPGKHSVVLRSAG